MGEHVDLGIDGLTDYHEIGSGGFATVYSALESGLERRVAVKVITAADDAARRRFDRERSSLGRTAEHPNIVTPFRSGYTHHGNQPYLVMELLTGGSLQDRLERKGPLPLSEALETTIAVADALDYSHRSGVLHKDIKPANVLMTRSGAPKLADFGIAAIQEGTATGQVAYSLLYTAPETFSVHMSKSGTLVDPRDERSDVYSLAATFFALTAGVPPFHAPTSAALVNQILNQAPPSTSHAHLDQFFLTALAKDPAQRLQSAAELGASLLVLLKQLQVGDAPSSGQARVSVTVPGQQHRPAIDPVVSPPSSALTLHAPAGQAPTGTQLTGTMLPPADGASRPTQPHVPGEQGAGTIGYPSAVPTQRGRLRRWLALSAGGLLVVSVITALVVTRPDNPGSDTDSGSATQSSVAVDDSGPAGRDAVILAPQGGPVFSVAQLSDGRMASGGSDGTVHLWDPDHPGTTLAVYSGHRNAIRSLVQLADGRIASASTDGTVQIWDPDKPATTQVTYRRHESDARSVVELSDGRVASAGPGAVHIWDPSEPEGPLVAYMGHESNSVQSIAVLSDGRIASAQGDEVHLWEPSDPTRTLAVRPIDTSASGFAVALATLSDGRVAMATGAGVEIWDPDKPDTTLAAYRGHANGARSLVELADGRIASGGSDGIRIWHPSDPDTTLASYEIVDPTNTSQLAALNSGRIALTTSGGVWLWDPARPDATPATFTGHTAGATSVVEIAGGQIAAAHHDGVRIWDPSAPQSPLGIYEGHTDWVSSLVALGDGRVASASGDGTVKIWRPDDPTTTLATFVVAGGEVWELLALNDGRLVSAGSTVPVQIWDPDAPDSASIDYRGHGECSVGSLTELADGRLASVGVCDAKVHIWDPSAPENGAEIAARQANRILGLADGKVVSTAFSLREIELWDPLDPDVTLATYRGHTGYITAVLELSDGRIASGGLDGIRIWDPSNTTVTVAMLTDHTSPVLSIIELADGRIASAGADGVRIYDVS